MTKNNDAPLAGMLVNVYLPNAAGETMFTQDDATVPARGKYYVLVKNKPYATIFNRSFNYPVEGVNRDKLTCNTVTGLFQMTLLLPVVIGTRPAPIII